MVLIKVLALSNQKRFEIKMDTIGITITFSESVENHVGMQQIGEIAEHGFTSEDINLIAAKFPVDKIQIINLHENQPVSPLPNAQVLLIKESFPYHRELLAELLNLEWDSKALMYGRVVNKKARFNLCFADFSQEPDYENGKGRVIPWSKVPYLHQLKTFIETNFPKCADLKAEGNLYYDINTCGIGYHGDSERKKVIGLRFGGSFPIVWRWFKNNKKVGNDILLDNFSNGDMYIMSEKAVGND